MTKANKIKLKTKNILKKRIQKMIKLNNSI